MPRRCHLFTPLKDDAGESRILIVLYRKIRSIKKAQKAYDNKNNNDQPLSIHSLLE